MKDTKVHVLIKRLMAIKVCIVLKLLGIYVIFQWYSMD